MTLAVTWPLTWQPMKYIWTYKNIGYSNIAIALIIKYKYKGEFKMEKLLRAELELQGLKFKSEDDFIAAVEYIKEYDYDVEDYIEETLENYPELLVEE